MAYPPPPTSTLSTKVELHISCKGLMRADVLSKSDPLVAVFTYQGNSWIEHGRTEMIENTHDPNFTKSIEMMYRFEEVQKLKFKVYDVDNETRDLGDDSPLGTMECTLGEIVSAEVIIKPLMNYYAESGTGTITVRAEEVSDKKSLLTMVFSAQGLDKKDFMGKSDPFLEFERENVDGTYSSVLKSTVIPKTLNPSWPPLIVTTQTLTNNDMSRKLRVRCFDWDSDGSHDLIGEFYTTLGELMESTQHNKLEWPFINPKKTKKKSYKNSGTCHLDSITVQPLFSFLDYIMGGCQINFTVGIDFTASNGSPTEPSSLHYLDPLKPNQYTQALTAVGAVCQDYDSDKLFPALGFGGVIGNNQVSHEFALNGNPQNPYCFGIAGVVEAYHKALQNVSLSGPTNAAPIINHVANFAEEAAKNVEIQQYFILLMLTDGALSDMAKTKQAVIRASRLPMSIIIVGVGEANFASMRELDADEEKLTVGSEVAERDIVQFVPFKDYVHSSPAHLASTVLAEIPKQLEEYMTKRKLAPLKRPQQPQPQPQ